MHIKNIFLLLCTSLLFVACAGAPAKKVSLVEDKILGQKGFTLSLSELKGWIVTEEGPYKVVLSKQNPNKHERYTIQALVVKLPNFKDDDAFLSYIEESMAKNSDKSKLNIIEQQVNLTSGEGKRCVMYNSKEEPTKKTSNKKSLVLGMVNFTCRHPDKKNAGVYLAYSKKAYRDNIDDNLITQAKNIFSQLKFSAF